MLRVRVLTASVLVLLLAPAAYSYNELQLYIEGATYDLGSQTWVYAATGPMRLWTVGNVGAKGRIDDVKLSVAYDAGLTPGVSLTSSMTGGYGGFIDPSTPGAATYLQTRTDGSAPLLGDGTSLPTHGIYGAGTWWQEFALGDFTLTDSYIADFKGSLPSPDLAAWGQINVYEVSISNLAVGQSVHFDLYDHYYNKKGAKYKFAPFSHDAEGGVIPEPGTLALLGLGLAGLGARLRRKR